MSARFSGLTWDHPRGYEALAAAAHEVAPGLIDWDRQPLEGFESHPVGELADRYDLIVLDHPHIGEAVALGCLRPIESIFHPDEVAQWAAQSIGASMQSYCWQRQHYALPLDVATQVSACGVLLIGDPPDTWDEVLRLSETLPVAVSIAGPHALLSFFSICLSCGALPGQEQLVDDRAVAVAALAMMQRLDAQAPGFTRTLNPIGLLEAMRSEAPLAYVPLVYGYVNYATAPAGQHPVRFAEAPRGPSGRRGSVLGGTGIAISARARLDDELVTHLRWLLDPATQRGFIARHSGQPSARSAWQDIGVNTAVGNFYRRTIDTTEGAWVRPRFDGYIAFQSEAARVIRQGLDGDAEPAAIFTDLNDRWRRACDAARGPTIQTRDQPT